MDKKLLFVHGGDFDGETGQFAFLIVSQKDPPVPGSWLIVDRNIIVHLIQNGYCVSMARPWRRQVHLVEAGGEGYLRTDGQAIAGDYIEGISITRSP